jgi:hypothetical protein
LLDERAVIHSPHRIRADEPGRWAANRPLQGSSRDEYPRLRMLILR